MHLFLTVITLGCWIPFKDIMMHHYKMKHLYFGSQQANFTKEYKTLVLSHIENIITFFVPLLIFLLFATLFSLNNSEKIALPLIFFVGFIARYWYRATFLRIQYNNLTLGNIGFICTITGGALLIHRWVNAFILIFTVGLGLPIVIQRNMKFFSKHVRITGDVDNAIIQQAPGGKDKQGEGLGSVFDTHIDLF